MWQICLLAVQARTYPHRTENGNKIQLIPGKMPAGRAHSAWKTITDILHIGQIGLKVDSVSLPPTVSHHVFWETQRLSHIIYSYMCLKPSVQNLNTQCNAVKMFHILKKFTFCRFKATGNQWPLPQKEQYMAPDMVFICPSTYSNLKPILAQMGVEERLKLHSLLTFAFYWVSLPSALAH